MVRCVPVLSVISGSGILWMTDYRITGPRHPNPVFIRPRSFAIADLMKTTPFEGDDLVTEDEKNLGRIAGQDNAFDDTAEPDEALKRRYQSRLSRAVAALQKSPEGAALLLSAMCKDQRIGAYLEIRGVFGCYLSKDKVAYTKTSDMGRCIHNLAHELAHAQQDMSGLSTMVIYHQKGTLLPYDAWSYVVLNRCIEAAAEATAVQICWDIKEAGDPRGWEDARKTYSQLTKAFQQSVTENSDNAHNGRAKAAAFDAMFKQVFFVPNNVTYDQNMVAVLAGQAAAEKEAGLIAAARRIDADTLAAVGLNEDGTNWLEGRRLDRGLYAQMSDELRSAVEALNITVLKSLSAPDPSLFPQPYTRRHRPQFDGGFIPPASFLPLPGASGPAQYRYHP